MNNIYGLSFPKAGRTWIRLMIAKVYSRLLDVDVKQLLNQEHGKVKDYTEKPLICPNGNILSHILFRHGPEKGRISQEKFFPSFYEDKKAFLLVRNPLDVVTSFFYHKKYYRNAVFNGNIYDFLHYPYQDASNGSQEARFGLMPIINYMNTFIENRDRFKGFNVFFYEDFRDDPLLNLRLLLDFCIATTVDNSLLVEAVKFCSFDNMRTMEQDNTLQWHALPGSENANGLKTRNGKVKAYKDELNTSEIDKLKKIIKSNLNPFYEKYIE